MLFRWLVDPHVFGLEPAAGVSAPARWIGLAGGLVDLGSLLANGLGGSTVALVWCHEFDAAVVVPVIVPIHKCTHPFAGLVLAGKGPAGVIRPVFDRTEQGFRVRVVVGDPGAREGSEHPHLLQPRFQRGPTQLFEKPAARHSRCRHGESVAAAGTGGCQSRWVGGSAP